MKDFKIVIEKKHNFLRIMSSNEQWLQVQLLTESKEEISEIIKSRIDTILEYENEIKEKK